MEDPKDGIPVDEYIMGRLEASERLALEANIRENPALANEVELEKEVLKAATLVGQEQLRERLSGLFLKAKKKEQPIALYLGVAASIGALILFAYLMLGSSPNTDEIFANYYQPYPTTFTSRGESSDIELLTVSQLYEEGKYNAAIPLFETLLANREDDGQLQLALGICYLETERLEQAQELFQNIRAEGLLLYKDLAVWYLSLSLMKMDELETAKMWLQVLADDPEADKNVEAQQLLLELH